MRKLFGLWSSLSTVFDTPNPTGAAPANDPNAGGGNPDPAKAAGGGGSPQPNSRNITVDGKEHTLTEEELVRYAQLGFSSTQRYQEASAKEKAAEAGIRISQLVDRISDDGHQPTDEEIKELAVHLKVDPTWLMSQLAEDSGTPAPGDKGGSQGLDKETLKAALKELIGMEPAEVGSVLQYSHAQHIQQAKRDIRELSDGAVDKDQIFVKMIGVGEDKNKDRESAIKEMVAEDVLRKIQDGVPFGADMIAETVQQVRARLTKIGIPGRPVEYPISLGLGPGAGLPAEIHADEPIKRKNAFEDDGERNVVSRYLQQALKIAKHLKG